MSEPKKERTAQVLFTTWLFLLMQCLQWQQIWMTRELKSQIKIYMLSPQWVDFSLNDEVTNAVPALGEAFF